MEFHCDDDDDDGTVNSYHLWPQARQFTVGRRRYHVIMTIYKTLFFFLLKNDGKLLKLIWPGE
jgi:hypothetical protein